MITGPSGIYFISSCTTSTNGWLFKVSVIILEKLWRSTARALPAGTRVASAHFMINESNLRISSFKIPTAFSNESLRKELEQTNSPNNSL